jgi:hypothetical protein
MDEAIEDAKEAATLMMIVGVVAFITTKTLQKGRSKSSRYPFGSAAYGNTDL